MDKQQWDHFPLFISSKGKKVLIVGGGQIATRRLKALLPFSFSITLVSPQLTPELQELKEHFTYLERTFSEEDLHGNFLVLACTQDKAFNLEIAKKAHQLKIYISVASSKEASTFFFPGMYFEDELLFALSSDGKDYHKTAQLLRQKRKDLHED